MSAPEQQQHPAVASIIQQQHPPQQQQQQPQQPSPVHAPSPTSSGVDSLTCQWANCGERCSAPEQLYEHVCERHVGRKSTNNLNLQCHWGQCRTTTVKRDHITSHIRVHVPLKPHKCEFCGKSFKRPQDLKKHVKTHADDSVIMRNTNNGEPSQQRASFNGYHQTTAKPNQGFYPAANPNNNGPYHQYPGPSNPQSQLGGNNMGGGYGHVYYNLPQSSSFNDGGLTESRKRNHDLLNQLFGEAKRGQVDPGHYMDLGTQFGGVQGLPPSVSNSLGNGYTNGGGGGGGGLDGHELGQSTAYQTMHQPPSLQAPHLQMPFPQLKTKNDLQAVDNFLLQLSQTVYENAPRRPTAHPPPDHGGIDPGLRDSPPNLPSIHGSEASTNTMDDTPALTPGSQFSTQSPPSAHSNYNPSPVARSSASLYPSLPNVNASVGDTHNGTWAPSNGAPPSGLANGFEDYQGRRFQGGYLGRVQPRPSSRANDGSDTASPGSRRGSTDDREAALAKGVKNVDIATSPTDRNAQNGGVNLPPIHRHKTSGSEGSSSSSEANQEAWVQNIRVIEALRQYVQTKLESGEYDGENSDDQSNGAQTPRAHRTEERSLDVKEQQSSPGASLYPNLKPMETSS
ncbi:MAG: hypothetical protein M1831_000226 [Alyxoria varia]|nr:MAG: hypothetical protein M1831_000226 [Alyxoria varia]